jgi:hypothetical protein
MSQTSFSQFGDFRRNSIAQSVFANTTILKQS